MHVILWWTIHDTPLNSWLPLDWAYVTMMVSVATAVMSVESTVFSHCSTRSHMISPHNHENWVTGSTAHMSTCWRWNGIFSDFIRWKWCRSLELAGNTRTQTLLFVLYCTLGSWKCWHLLEIRIPCQIICNEPNCVSSNLKLCAILSHERYSRLPARNGSNTASPSAGNWSSPPTTGPRPPPSSGFTFTAISKEQAVLFGGYQPRCGVVNDVCIIDFSSMVWWECTCNMHS